MFPGLATRPRPASLRCHRFSRTIAGSLSIEFALTAPMLALVILNVVDFGLLIMDSMDVASSAQMGAQAAYKKCAAGPTPATTKCPALSAAVTTAIQGSSLGTGVTLASGSPSEAYYCLSGTTLQQVGTASAPPNPFNCSAVGNPGTAPSDYIQISVNYSYQPVFPGLSLASAQTLTRTAMERLQ